MESFKIGVNQGKKIINIKPEGSDFASSLLTDGTPYHYLKTDYFVGVEWEDIEEVEIELEFYGVKDGIETKYLAKKKFKPEFKKAIGLHFTETYL